MSHSKHKPALCACPECEIDQMARNNYFTGKLMVERDFTDEQRYFRGKLQRHNHNLHGSGVVCGLKVVPHPNPACQDKYVIIEPGTAIDCCGNEIIVRDELRGALDGAKGVLFNFANAPEIKKLWEPASPSHEPQPRQPHLLQFCVRYKECCTEEIPVLYDECGCDETRCAPNRVLESYEIEAHMVPDVPPHEVCPENASLDWRCSIPFAHSTHVVLHDATHRLYVMSEVGGVSALHALSTDNHAVVDTVTLGDKGVALAISNDGSRIYVAVAKPRVMVLDANHLSAAPVDLSLGTAADRPTFLSVAPDDRLFGLFAPSGDIAVWDNFGAAATPTKVLNISPPVKELVFSADGKMAYGANGSVVQTVDLSATTVGSLVDLKDPAAKPYTVAIARGATGDTLIVGSKGASKLYLKSLGLANADVASVTLTHYPIALVASPGGNWIYVLETIPTIPRHWWIEPVNVYRAEQNKPDALGDLVDVGDNATQLALSQSVHMLYVGYFGQTDVDDSGGVAMLEVCEADCEELLWKGLEGCPSCDTPDCIVLATMENYHVGDRLVELPDPPAAPASGTTQINNRKGRRLLPSTQTLLEVIECLLECGCKTTPAPTPQPPPTPTPQPPTFTRICGINWEHDGATSISQIKNDNGFLIAFDGPLSAADISSHRFIVLTSQRDAQRDRICWCEVPGEVRLVHFKVQCDLTNKPTPPTAANPPNGAWFKPLASLPAEVEYRIILKGDFIQDKNGKAIDADHLPPWFPSDKYLTGDGIEGGTFESWFKMTR